MEKTYTIFAVGSLKPILSIKKGAYKPKNAVFCKVVKCESVDVNKIAEDIFYEEFVQSVEKIEVGSVVAHSDGGKNHHGVVIDIKDETAFIVVCTTNYSWNKEARQATNEELDLFGFTVENTYLAPVVRPTRELHNMKYSFPTYRIEGFQKEFGHLLFI